MPQVQTKNPVVGRTLTDAILSALDTNPAAALIVTPWVHLFTAGPAPVLPTSVSADFTEATFVGYAPVALPMPLLGPIQIDPNDRSGHHEVDFLAGAVVAPGETIIGYYVDDDDLTPTKLYLGEIFETPIEITSPGDYVSLDVNFAAAESFALQT